MKICHESSGEESQTEKTRKSLHAKRKNQDDMIDSVETILYNGWNCTFKNETREKIRNSFTEVMPLRQMIDAAQIAADKDIGDLEGRLKYFYGVCWGTIKADGREYGYEQ
jgi:hypothetical protein